ncbi:MAG: SUMF1/EgtB/PvdO family nonheme iron enzyme [Candidatus Sumerlaeota bacterium]|nr:SUMF1/EgtB/PvdO family nonheme iron enzyme [Candidatus Sumerlaeota bacterium]
MRSWRNPEFDQTDTHPVVNVNWDDAKAFCDWLARKTGRAYQLPTEAQWEYACRAGTKTLYQWGDDPDGGKGWCNCADQSAKGQFPDWKSYFNWDDGYIYTAPVKSFKPNAWGLYDMLGNALEWVLRGGSWQDGPDYCRSASRLSTLPTFVYPMSGFRVCLVARTN